MFNFFCYLFNKYFKNVSYFRENKKNIIDSLRVKIALFFTLLFSILLITPTVISLVDNTQDITFLLEMNEEEENKGKESAKDLEIKLPTSEHFNFFFLNGIQKMKNVSFQSKNYTSEYPKITTPPPKFLI